MSCHLQRQYEVTFGFGGAQTSGVYVEVVPPCYLDTLTRAFDKAGICMRNWVVKILPPPPASPAPPPSKKQ